jgi:SmpA / OmlA family
MSLKKKSIPVVLALLIVIPLTELAREEFAYLSIAKAIKNSYSLVQPGMTRDEVELLAGRPDSKKKTTSEEILYWDGAQHQGKLWTLLGLTWRKGHQTLVVELNTEGRVTRTWGGIN